MELFIIWLALAGVTAYFAKQKGRNPVGWFIRALSSPPSGLSQYGWQTRWGGRAEEYRDRQEVWCLLPLSEVPILRRGCPKGSNQVQALPV